MASHKNIEGYVTCSEVPIFRPSVEEWKDPLKYLSSLRVQVQPVGMAKIVLPSSNSWEPPFSIDRKKTKFMTKLQRIHELKSRDSVADAKEFWAAYISFQESTGSKTKRKPLFNGQEIDLYKLFRLVTKRGGYKDVCAAKRWKEIVAALEIEDKGSNAATTLKQQYAKLLLPFEEHCVSRNKGGAGLLADAIVAEMDNQTVHGKRSRPEELDEPDVSVVAEAMLGLVPPSPESDQGKKKGDDQPRKKRRKSKNSSKAHSSDDEMFSTSVCEHCKGGHYEEQIILCDRCDNGWHLFCLQPPLEKVPKGDWVCPNCDSSKKGLQGGDAMVTLEEFESNAKNFESAWSGGERRKVTVESRMKEYWNVVNRGEDLAEVFIGRDPMLAKRRKKQKESGMEMVPQWKNSTAENLARLLENNIPGVHWSVTQFGMLFSTNMWSVEACLLPSLTYLHSGASKCWYCVPSYAAGVFEQILAECHPKFWNCGYQGDSPLSPSVMISPKELIDRGVPVYECTQEAGTLVVVFPNVYRCSIDLGINISESLMYIPPEWLQHASQAASLYRNHRAVALIHHERLMLKAMEHVESLGIETIYWIAREFERVLKEETVLRFKLWSEGLVRSICAVGKDIEETSNAEENPDSTIPKETKGEIKRSRTCCVCNQPVVFSMVECDCSSKRVACLHHRQSLCTCKIHKQKLIWRYSLLDLDNMLQTLLQKVETEHRQEIEQHETLIESEIQKCMVATEEKIQKLDNHRRELVMVNVLGKEDTKKRNFLKCKRGECTDTLRTLSRVTRSGYVQGPLRKFCLFDVHPEDAELLEKWRKEMANSCEAWIALSNDVLNVGGEKADLLPDLVDEGEQYLWGGAGPELTEEAAKLQPRLKAADKFIETLLNAINGTPSLEDVERILSTDPLPIQNPIGISELEEDLKLAKEWRGKYGHLVNKEGSPMDSKALESIVAEATKVSIGMDEVKCLKDRLSTIRKVADAIRSALPSNRDAGRRKREEDLVSLEQLENLQREAVDAHIMMPEIVNLNAAMDKIRSWQDRVQTQLKNRPSWAVIEVMIEEGRNLPCEMPDIQMLYKIQDKVNDWISQMHEMLEQRTPLKKLREMLTLGEKLPMSFEEIGELQSHIQQVEWEEYAKKVLSSKGSLATLQNILATAEYIQNVDHSVLEAVQIRVNTALKWQRKVQQFEEDHMDSNQDPPVWIRPTVGEIETLLREGEVIGVRMEKLNKYSQQYNGIVKWQARARQCIGNITLPLASPKIVDTKVPLVDVEASELHHSLRQKRIWLNPDDYKSLPSHSTVQKLMKDYESMLVHADEYDVLRALEEKAEIWLEQASPVLQQFYVTNEQIPELEDLVEKGYKTGLILQEVKILEANIEALLWDQTARDILSNLPAEHNSTQTTNESAQPSLVLLIALREAGNSLPCPDADVKATFSSLVDKASKWKKEARSILRQDKPRQVSLPELKNLLSIGKQLGVDMPELHKLRELTHSQEAWEIEVSDLLNRNNGRPSFDKIKQKSLESSKRPILSESKSRIQEIMQAADDWIAVCKKVLNLWNNAPNLPPLDILRWISNTIDSSIDQIARKSVQEKADRKAKAEGNDAELEDDMELYCLCQQTDSVDSVMVSCDICGEWYHRKCVGLTDRASKNIKDYICPLCQAIKNYNEPICEVVAKYKRLGIPSKEQLDSLQQQATGLRVLLAEEQALDSVLTKLKNWRNNVEQAVSSHIAYRDGKDEGALSMPMLHQLCKSALAMEVDSTDIATKVLQILRYEDWRSKVDLLYSATEDGLPNGSILENIAILITEATTLGLHNDFAVENLHRAYEEGRAWKDKADANIENLKSVGNIHHEDFYSVQDRSFDLIEEGLRLPIPLKDDVAILKEFSVPYCVCHSVFDEENELVECEGCGVWFHYECIGLKKGHIPHPFICPLCHIRNKTVCEFFFSIPQQSLNEITCASILMDQYKSKGMDTVQDFLGIIGSAAYQYLITGEQKFYDFAIKRKNGEAFLKELYSVVRHSMLFTLRYHPLDKVFGNEDEQRKIAGSAGIHRATANGNDNETHLDSDIDIEES